MYQLTIPGKPYPLKRPRHMRSGIVYDPKENTDAKAIIAQVARLSIKNPIEGPVRLAAVFYFQRPKSHYGKALKASAPLYHTQRPDVDNLIKTVLDGLNGIAWKDDAQVVEVSGMKMWSEAAPITDVTITYNEREEHDA